MNSLENIDILLGMVSVIGVIYIVFQVHDARKQAFGQFLFELDSQFQRYEEIHRSLMSASNNRYNPFIQHQTETWQYIGLFERCKVLIDKRTIDLDTFVAFYGYRLERLIANENLRNAINGEPHLHQYFIKLCNQVLKYRNRKYRKIDNGVFKQHVSELTSDTN